MEELTFKPGDPYRICEDCGEMVPASRLRCRKCGADILATQAIHRYVEETAEPEPSGGEAPLTEQARMRCIGCGAQWSMAHTSCPDCGGLLVLDIAEQRAEEQPDYCCEVLFYDEYREKMVASENKLVLRDGDTVLGRSLLLTPGLFFPRYSSKLDERFQTISREHIVITLSGGKLSVRLVEDGKRKNPVTVNGRRLESGDTVLLAQGDVLHLGTSEQSWVELRIQKSRPTGGNIQQILENLDRSVSDIASRTEKIQSGQEELLSGQKAILNSQQELKEAMMRLTPEDLHIDSQGSRETEWETYESTDGWQTRKCEDQEPDDLARLEELVPEVSGEELIKGTIREFLSMESSEYYTQLEEILDNKQLQHYLYQAAFFEGACKNMHERIGVDDYSAAMSFIGKAVEEFCRTEYAQVIFRSQITDFLEYLKEVNKGRPKKTFTLGELVRYFGKDKYKKQDVDIRIKSDRIRTVLKAVGEETPDKARVKAFRQAADQMVETTGLRNKSAHAEAPDDVALKINNDYIENSRKQLLSTLPGEEYQEHKRQIFSADTISVIHEYYKQICSK